MSEVTLPLYGTAAEKVRKHLAATRDVRSLLEAVLEAIDLPFAATTTDNEKRARILDERARLAVIVARAALAEDPDSIAWNADYLRTHLAAYPTTAYTAQAIPEAGQ